MVQRLSRCKYRFWRMYLLLCRIRVMSSCQLDKKSPDYRHFFSTTQRSQGQHQSRTHLKIRQLIQIRAQSCLLLDACAKIISVSGRAGGGGLPFNHFSPFLNDEQTVCVSTTTCNIVHGRASASVSTLSGKQDAVSRTPSDYWWRGSTLTLICTMNSEAHSHYGRRKPFYSVSRFYARRTLCWVNMRKCSQRASLTGIKT